MALRGQPGFPLDLVLKWERYARISSFFSPPSISTYTRASQNSTVSLSARGRASATTRRLVAFPCDPPSAASL